MKRSIENILEQKLTLNQFLSTVTDEEIDQLTLTDVDLDRIVRDYNNGDFQ